VVCQDRSDENKASYSRCYPNLMSFASFQEVDAVPIARSYTSKERTRYMKKLPTKINRLIPRATVLRSFQ